MLCIRESTTYCSSVPLFVHFSFSLFLVKDFSGTTWLTILNFGKKLDNDKLYCVLDNHPQIAYQSLYLSIFLSPALLLISPFIYPFFFLSHYCLSVPLFGHFSFSHTIAYQSLYSSIFLFLELIAYQSLYLSIFLALTLLLISSFICPFFSHILLINPFIWTFFFFSHILLINPCIWTFFFLTDGNHRGYVSFAHFLIYFLTLFLLGNFSSLLSSADFFKIRFLEKLFQKYHLSVKQIGLRSGPTLCRAWSGSNLFAKVEQTTLVSNELNIYVPYPNKFYMFLLCMNLLYF